MRPLRLVLHIDAARGWTGYPMLNDYTDSQIQTVEILGVHGGGVQRKQATATVGARGLLRGVTVPPEVTPPSYMEKTDLETIQVC